MFSQSFLIKYDTSAQLDIDDQYIADMSVVYSRLLKGIRHEYGLLNYDIFPTVFNLIKSTGFINKKYSLNMRVAEKMLTFVSNRSCEFCIRIFISLPCFCNSCSTLNVNYAELFREPLFTRIVNQNQEIGSCRVSTTTRSDKEIYQGQFVINYPPQKLIVGTDRLQLIKEIPQKSIKTDKQKISNCDELKISKPKVVKITKTSKSEDKEIKKIKSEKPNEKNKSNLKSAKTASICSSKSCVINCAKIHLCSNGTDNRCKTMNYNGKCEYDHLCSYPMSICKKNNPNCEFVHRLKGPCEKKTCKKYTCPQTHNNDHAR